jgi:hypothetical protein
LTSSLMARRRDGLRTSAIIDQTLGRGLFCDSDHTTPYSTLRSQLCHRSYLSNVLERYCKKYADC